MLPSASFAQVVLDIPLLPVLTYKVEKDQAVAVGLRCVVPLGRREVVGMIVQLTEVCDIEPKKQKSIIRVFDDVDPVDDKWLRLTKFASDYYQHGWGEVALSCLPNFFRTKPGVRYQQSLDRLRKQGKRPTFSPQVKHDLNEEQTLAVQTLKESSGFSPMVLHGVTGSGKTEVYLNMMESVFNDDSSAQVLFLVPEINLTPQLESRVRSHFPDISVVCLHSGLSQGERARSWLAMHEKRAQILIGTRMSVFASIPNLKLIVVDEEHDLSYKAGDGIRYSARDLAVKRAQLMDIPVVLGSATPSLETWAHVRAQRYQLLTLHHRAVKDAVLPTLEVINPKEGKTVSGLAQSIVDEITQTLERKEQVIVFLNRRGYAPVLTCPSCGWLSTCPHCSTYAVYHKSHRRLMCHHCGWTAPVYSKCPDCGNVDLAPLGAGTQRIEEQLQALWPQAKILRIDRDSTQRKNAAQKAFEAVHAGEVDILVGTQMVAKGHDFQNVSLVVVLNVDAQLVSANPRSEERAFANLMQVAGRAGRGGLTAKLMVQSRFGDRPIFKALAQQNYEMFVDELLAIREMEGTSPFVSQALLLADAPNLDKAIEFLTTAVSIGEAIRDRYELNEIAIFDPIPMAVMRVADRDRGQLLIEAPSRAKLNQFLSAWMEQLSQLKTSVHWVMDVDPIDV